jgi:hypothetical protein
VRAYLLENPEVIIEAMTELQAREDKAAANRDLQMLADHKDAIFNEPRRLGRAATWRATSRWSSSWITAAAIATRPSRRSRNW